MRHLLALLLLFAAALSARAGEPFLKPNDVIALVGGEDLVVANELGYLETLLQASFPSLHLRIRSLAWEGDTVFEQHRDLNYPTLDTQLDKMGATVVIAHFGQMESLRGKEHLPEFIDAYEKLLGRLAKSQAHPGVTRRLFVLTPNYNEGTGKERIETLGEYRFAVSQFCSKHDIPNDGGGSFEVSDVQQQRDGVHLSETLQEAWAEYAVSGLPFLATVNSLRYGPHGESLKALRAKILEKNRLWFQYTRPQNWAFLAGDRTNQPSSRDYRDPSKRWFPDEMEQFLPLIEAKDKEIWAAAAKQKADVK